MVSKTRVYGPGHWMVAESSAKDLLMLDSVGEQYTSAFHPPEADEPGETARLVARCKQLAREIKSGRPSRRGLAKEVVRLSPGSAVEAALVNLYFATFESGYRILDQTSFMDSYNTYLLHSNGTPDGFLVQLLLTMAIAAPLHDDYDVIACKIPSWVEAAERWLAYSTEKDRLTVEAVQGHCLLLLARQVNRMGADLAWVTAGSLIRTSIHIGLHQDPECFPGLPLREKELRRRLWYTILEMDAQAALDAGAAPAVTPGEYSTKPPCVDDDNSFETGRGDSASTTERRPRHALFQTKLAESLPLRLRILQTINHMQLRPTYEEILSLDNGITLACREFAAILPKAQTTSNDRRTGRFAINFCVHLLHRFTLALHYPFALKHATNSSYSHSRKVCLTTTQNLCSLLDDEIYARVLVTGGGMFRDLVTRGLVFLIMEVMSEVNAGNDGFPATRKKSRLEPLLEDLRRIQGYVKDRMVKGDTNIKAFVTLEMVMAQVNAQLEGREARLAALEALRSGLHQSQDVLESMLRSRREQRSGTRIETQSHVQPQPLGDDLNLGDLYDGTWDFDFDLGLGFDDPW